MTILRTVTKFYVERTVIVEVKKKQKKCNNNTVGTSKRREYNTKHVRVLLNVHGVLLAYCKSVGNETNENKNMIIFELVFTMSL